MVHPIGTGAYAISFAGQLGLSWAANLSGAFAAERINVLRGRASRDGEGYWVARFEVEVPHPSIDLSERDWLAVVRTSHEFVPAEVRLSRYAFHDVRDHGGSIRLDLDELSDSVGLLAVIFSWLASLDLVPVEFKLETRGTTVHDEFWLKALEETRPRDEVCLALGRRLAELVAA